MIAIDKADEVLAILYAHPEKLSREFLKKYNLSASLFPLEHAQEILFRLIVTASYANKKVTEALIEAYCVKNKISDEEKENTVFALDRIKEQDKDFAEFEDKLLVYRKELKTAQLNKLVFATNKSIQDGKDIDQILEKHREQLQSIVQEQQNADVRSLRGRSSEFIKQYEESDATDSLVYGFDSIDEAIGRINPGEVHLIAGASNEGKSIVLANIAYNNLIRKKNMFYASLEMSEKQCIYRLLALHSTHPKFGYNLEHKRIKAKDLTEREKEQLYDVATDLFECEDYGELFFTDTATTVAEIFDEAEDINRFKKLHGICIDYISLLQGKGSSEQAVIANNFKAIKSKALLFNKGEQIPVISVHQIAEQKKEQAEESGKYDFNFLSDTSEAKKSSDVVSWILRTEQHRQVHELSWGINKVRDSDGVGNTYSLFEDFQHMRVQLIDTEIE